MQIAIYVSEASAKMEVGSILHRLPGRDAGSRFDICALWQGLRHVIEWLRGIMLVLIDNYDSFTYNLVHFLGELGASCEVFRNDKITVEAVLGLRPKGVVLSPGPCTPKEAGICLDLVKATRGELPLLGVCLGHQAIGDAYGGKVVRAPTLMHGKLSRIRHGGQGLFKDLPGKFDVTRYHSLVVERSSLPEDLIVTAETDDGIIMGMEHKTHPVHGVQFHPESIASEHGHALLANFLTMAGYAPRRRNAPAAATAAA